MYYKYSKFGLIMVITVFLKFSLGKILTLTHFFLNLNLIGTNFKLGFLHLNF